MAPPTLLKTERSHIKMKGYSKELYTKSKCNYISINMSLSNGR